MGEPIIGSLEREEAKEMGMIRNRSKRAETSFFLRMALTDYGVKMFDPDEGIQLANRFVSYLEVLRAMAALPERTQAAMIEYFGKGGTPVEIAARFHISERTFWRWLGDGLDAMAEVIWASDEPKKPPQ